MLVGAHYKHFVIVIARPIIPPEFQTDYILTF